MRILHVTECYDGGVRRAIDTIAELTPEFDHVLLTTQGIQPSNPLAYEAVERMPDGLAQRILSVNRTASDRNVDVIHAHSSWAGVYTRAGRRRLPVVYEPHCFAFDDPRRNCVSRWAFRFAEAVLGRRTAATLVLSPHEQRLAENLMPSDKVVWMPNIPSLSAPVGTRVNTGDDASEIVMVGRLAGQKDPEFFAHVAQAASAANPALKFTWIGDGSAVYRQMLVDGGVEVTGWLEDLELQSRLGNAALYFHSAQYEGFPLSVLDAASLGIPIIVRNLPSFDGTPLTQISSVEEASQKILEALAQPSVMAQYEQQRKELLETMTPEAQRNSLYRAYEIATDMKQAVYKCA